MLGSFSAPTLPSAAALSLIHIFHQRPGVPGMRSTFGTMTELLNSLRLMFSRPVSYTHLSLLLSSVLRLISPSSRSCWVRLLMASERLVKMCIRDRESWTRSGLRG